MPVNQLTNPAPGQTFQAIPGYVYETYINNTTATMVLGELVALTTQFTGVTPHQFLNVKKAPTAASFVLVGIVVGGKSGANGKFPKGNLVEVCTMGVCQALFHHATVTFKHSVIASTGTAGQCKTAATPVLGKTIGVVLQTVAVATPSGLVWIRVEKK